MPIYHSFRKFLNLEGITSGKEEKSLFYWGEITLMLQLCNKKGV